MNLPTKLKQLCTWILPILALFGVVCVLLISSGGREGVQASRPPRRQPTAAVERIPLSLESASSVSSASSAWQASEPKVESLRVELRPPSLDGWPTQPKATRRGHKRPDGFPLTAVAYYFRTEIYGQGDYRFGSVGYMRRGARLAARGPVKLGGCRGGQWYAIAGSAYVCTSQGVKVDRKPGPVNLPYKLPDTADVLPYRYVKVETERAPRMYRVPTATEQRQIAAALAGEGKWPEVVEKPMDGIYLLAVAEKLREGGQAYIKTVFGRVVRADDVEPRVPSQMRGEVLRGRWKLPLAFVYGGDHPVYRLKGGHLQKAGIARKHARIPVVRSFKRSGKRYVMGPDGHVLARKAVRIVRATPRPEKVPSGARWIHVDLSEQSLVAYQGQRPVFATVVSGGKEGHEAPPGVFRISKKHVSVTMNGPDPDEGWYEVEEVPWTQYYWESYALHGAYWHDDFGDPRSHGCTNLAPADARWLFHWTDPVVPKGWQGVEQRAGTWVSVTG